MRFQKCEVCGRLNTSHNVEQRDECNLTKRDRETKRVPGVYYKRLELATQIIRRQKRISRVQLAREIDKTIQTTPWTLDKMKKDILEENKDVRWDGKASRYYVDTTLDIYIGKQDRLEKSFSLSFSDLR